MSPRGLKTLLFILTIAGSLAKALAYEVEAGSDGKDCGKDRKQTKNNRI